MEYYILVTHEKLRASENIGNTLIQRAVHNLNTII